MAQQNTLIYHAFYKIAYQAKSKVWINKNSRLRRFYNIRGRKLIRGGYFKRIVLVFNNMKWTLARRSIRPYMRRRKPSQRNLSYRNLFYIKQQIQHFYGKIKEQKFRTFFSSYLTNVSNRNTTFLMALESRLDVILYRMHLLPTIFMCYQFINYYGVLVNQGLEKTPYKLLQIGDIVKILPLQWKILNKILFIKIHDRSYGRFILKRRQIRILKKKIKLVLFSKIFQHKFIKWIKKFNKKQLLFNFQKLLKFNLKLFKHFYFKLFFLSKYQIIKNQKQYFLLQQTLNELVLFKKQFKLFEQNLQSILNSWIIYPKKYKISQFWTLIKIIKKFFKQYFFYKNLSYQLEIKELQFFKQFLFLSYKETQEKKRGGISSIIIQQWNYLFNKKEQNLILKQKIWQKKYNQYFTSLLNLLLNRKYLFLLQNKFLQKNRLKKNFLYYFLIKRKYKKRRRYQTVRFKATHWYIPSYLYFDICTLRILLINTPIYDNILFPFKCSLLYIKTFYHSRGY